MTSEQIRERAREIVKFLNIGAERWIMETDEELMISGDPGQAGVQIEGYYLDYTPRLKGRKQSKPFTLFKMQFWREYGQDFADIEEKPLLRSEHLEPVVFELARRVLADHVSEGESAWYEREFEEQEP